jgi:peroxiredoxin
MRPPVGPVLTTLLGLALVASVAPLPTAAAEPTLPAAPAAKLEAFRKVDWAAHLKPARPDPAPPSWKTRCEAEWTLAALPKADAAALLPLLGDGDRFVRALAARSVGIAQPDGAAKALLAALAAEKDKNARVALVEALGRVGGEGVLEAVEAQQQPGAEADVVFQVGIARRQLKGGAWDLASIRGEHADALRVVVDGAKVGEPAPELALPSPAGPVNLSTYKGRIVVLVFAHGDRGGADMKALQRLTMEQETLARWNVTVVVVDPHEKERTKAWAERLKLPFVVASDPAGRVAASYGVARQLFLGGEWLPSPAWCIVDGEGRLVWRKVGTAPNEQTSLGELMPVLDQVSRRIKVW